METYGTKIAEYRKKCGLTQQELGNQLKITPQAVSKWENGLSEPDIETIKKICELFGITVGELLGENGGETAETAAETAAEDGDVREPQTTQPNAATQINYGYCESCKKPLTYGQFQEDTRLSGKSRLYCKPCYAKLQKARADGKVFSHRQQTKKSLIWGGGVGGAVFLVLFIVAFVSQRKMPLQIGIPLSVIVGYIMFAFVSQMIWDGVINDMFFFSFHSFKMPGVIFTLDVEGILFLITVKLGLALLSVFLSVVFFLLIGLVLTPLSSTVTFPFSFLWRLRQTKKLRKDAEKYAKVSVE